MVIGIFSYQYRSNYPSTKIPPILGRSQRHCAQLQDLGVGPQLPPFFRIFPSNLNPHFYPHLGVVHVKGPGYATAPITTTFPFPMFLILTSECYSVMGLITVRNLADNFLS